MNIPPHLVNLAIRAASRSASKYRVGALIINGTRVVSFGFNRGPKTHPKSNNGWKSIHAEFDAILGLDPDYLLHATIIVVRITRTGKLATSRPCVDCHTLLKNAGVARMYYVTSERMFASEAV